MSMLPVSLGIEEPPSPPVKPAAPIERTTDRVSRAAHNRSLGKIMAAAHGWTGKQWTCLQELWSRESGWDHKAENGASGAYGIPQNITGGSSKYRRSAREQIEWGIRYIDARYDGMPCVALAHSDRHGWY